MKATSVRQFATSSAGCFLLLVWFALTTSDQYVGLVQCGMSKKFLSGFLIAILLGKFERCQSFKPGPDEETNQRAFACRH